MAKDKLSASDIQLLLEHYQKKLKKAEKNLIAAEKRVEKLRKKVGKALFLKQVKDDENMMEIFDGFVLESSSEVLNTELNSKETDTPSIAKQSDQDESKSDKSSDTTARRSGRKLKAQKEKSADGKNKEVKKVAGKDKSSSSDSTDIGAEQIQVKRGRKKISDVEKAKQKGMEDGNLRPISFADWNAYVTNYLANSKRPSMTKQIVAAAKEEFNYKDNEMAALERVIAKTLFNLSSKLNEIKKYKGDSKMRGYYYCLPKWFSSDGSIKKAYLNNIVKDEE
ncbi:MAG: hypothetical protein IPM47_06005 [Sphingobacteriales bacterium]|nr:MAG: hypothetical protein IPM47_06005 [Sphingobacteriales bacterium]